MRFAGDMSAFETRDEIFRVARLCAPCLDTLGPLTFHGDPASTEELQIWLNTVWIPRIRPALDSAHAAARIGNRELAQIDRQIDLSVPSSKSHRAAGEILATQFKAPASEPKLMKFLEAVKRGESPGHFAVVFAARASVFHIPLPMTRAAFVFLEMRTAPIESFWSILGDCLRFNPPVTGSLHAA